VVFEPTPGEIDLLLEGCNVFGQLSSTDRHDLEMCLRDARRDLRSVPIGHGGIALTPGCLYGVLRGIASVGWWLSGDRWLCVAWHHAADLFGEIQLGNRGAVLPDFALRIEARGRMGSAHVIEVPQDVVAELKSISALADAIDQIRAIRLCQMVRVLIDSKRSALAAVANLCLSPFPGQHHHFDSALRYRGDPVVIEKLVSIKDLAAAAGLAINTVRGQLEHLEARGLIEMRRSPGVGSRLKVREPLGLMRVLDEQLP